VNTKDIFNAAHAQQASAIQEERHHGQVRNSDPTSHLGMFEERDIKQTVRRGAVLGDAIAKALTLRVDPGGGVKFISFKEWATMQKDPEWQSLQTYVKKLVEYDDGRLRPRPLRPVLSNEVGMYRGNVYCVRGDNPEDDGSIKVFVPKGQDDK